MVAVLAVSALTQAPPAQQPAPPGAPAPAGAPNATTPGSPAPQGRRIAVIVLDPGHGGADAGARGTQISEADVVLDFSRAIRVALEAKGFTAVLTRGNPGE